MRLQRQLSDAQGQRQNVAVLAPNGRVHVIDWFARRQPHVRRLTCAAELHGHIDGMNQGLLIQSVLTEIAPLGPQSAAQLSEFLETESLLTPMEACLMLGLSSMPPLRRTPQCQLTSTCTCMCLSAGSGSNGIIRRHWWLAARDVCADGLTKGACVLDSLNVITSTGLWKFVADAPLAYIAEPLSWVCSPYLS